MAGVILGLLALAVSAWAIVRVQALEADVELLLRRLTALEQDLRG